MGREVRRVPIAWEHPLNPITRRPIPLLDVSYPEAAAAWDSGKSRWLEGFHEDMDGTWAPNTPEMRGLAWETWVGASRPTPEAFMPEWPEAERTHFQMYETQSLGTPLSPPFASIEDLARWLTEQHVPVQADRAVPYEQWLYICLKGWTPSMGLDGAGKLVSDDLQLEFIQE